MWLEAGPQQWEEEEGEHMGRAGSKDARERESAPARDDDAVPRLLRPQRPPLVQLGTLGSDRQTLEHVPPRPLMCGSYPF